jgi:ornithine carbamoyltransferase
MEGTFMSVQRDFLNLSEIEPAELFKIMAMARSMKRDPLAFRPFVGKTLALIFEKPSTRTRVSFEVAMRQLGGDVITLTGAEMQLGHGETITDTGHVLSRYVDIAMLRTFESRKMVELAKGASIPVINGLTNETHPGQVMADMMTAYEWLGDIKGKKAVWCGDGGDNVLNSWIEAAPIFGFDLTIVCPAAFAPNNDFLIPAQKKGAKIDVTYDMDAVKGADIVVTDCFVSMHNSDAAARQNALLPYQVNEGVMAKANKEAIFMHCLPAHRGEEVTNEVIDGTRSAVWDEAENRMHMHKAILCWCLGAEP